MSVLEKYHNSHDTMSFINDFDNLTLWSSLKKKKEIDNILILAELSSHAFRIEPTLYLARHRNLDKHFDISIFYIAMLMCWIVEWIYKQIPHKNINLSPHKLLLWGFIGHPITLGMDQYKCQQLAWQIMWHFLQAFITARKLFSQLPRPTRSRLAQMSSYAHHLSEISRSAAAGRLLILLLLQQADLQSTSTSLKLVFRLSSCLSCL